MTNTFAQHIAVENGQVRAGQPAGPSFPLIATGSIVKVTIPGNRSADDAPYEIPAIVLSQFPDDGTLRLFCFHFEGQFLSMSPAANVTVLFDAAGAPGSRADALAELREIVENDIATLQRQMTDFQDQVLGLVVGPEAPATPDPTPTIAPELSFTGDSIASGVASTRRRR